MATLILSEVGAVAGAQLLPQGLSLFGQTLSGTAIGGFIGANVGRLASLASPIEGHRIDSLRVMESREGAALPRVYGRMRLSGQVIWASRFTEHQQSESVGKGGPEINTYSYSVSFAVAIANAPITRIDRIWANGEVLETAGLNYRIYTGSETQLPDPLITAIEGSENAPAYRGTAYVVFEDLPLAAFGSRLPQLSFEVVRAGDAVPSSLRSLVQGINLIPATGEFVYATETVSTRRFPAVERPINLNNQSGEPDFVRSLDQLQADFPELRSVALTVAWFGTSLEASECRIMPGVETRDRETVPWSWSVGPFDRGDAHLVSDTDGRANYGGTPDDRSVEQGVAALKLAGYRVTISPFLLMDAPGFPWRGRISSSANGTDAVRSQIDAFLGRDGEGGFRHFILHAARLAKRTGADGVLLGSELVGLTRLQDGGGAFPFVEALIELATEVRSIVGPSVEISYAADWTEYGAYQKPGTADVYFPLDPLWMSPDLDFIGIDWYPPLTDWRDGASHLDAIAGYSGPSDAGYLRVGLTGGEAFDWYYGSDTDRQNQNRIPIIDTAHGENWVFRQKDLRGWYEALHFQRPEGVRDNAPTVWRPSTKPVRLMEIGFPAIDRGTNAPNRFFDPRSIESSLPPFSSGARDDLQQKAALEAALSFWAAQDFVDEVHVWCWDARPWPDFPQREEIWSDGENWAYGHWLNGRGGLITLPEIIDDLCAEIGLSVDTSELDGLVDGFAVAQIMPIRTALAPLMSAFDLIVVERLGTLQFTHRTQHGSISAEGLDPVEQTAFTQRDTLDKDPVSASLQYISADGDYAPALVNVGQVGGDALRVSLPIVLSQPAADQIAATLLERSQQKTHRKLALGPSGLPMELGTILTAGSEERDQITSSVLNGLVRELRLSPLDTSIPPRKAVSNPATGPAARPAANPVLILIDAPRVPGFDTGPLLACSADPWPGEVTVSAGVDPARLIKRAVCTRAAQLGRLVSGAPQGPENRWDDHTVLELDWHGDGLESVGDQAALAGHSLFLLQTDQGWELIAVARAELIGMQRWRLSRLIRGLGGSQSAKAIAGAICVKVGDGVLNAPLDPSEIGVELHWKAGRSELQTHRLENVAANPWRVGHLRTVLQADGLKARWTGRGVDRPASWALPELENIGTFRVELEFSNGEVEARTIDQAQLTLDPGVVRLRVAEIGADGRLGPWTSIPISDH